MADMAGSLANPPRPSYAAQAKPTAKTMATNMWLMRTSNDPPVSRKPVGASPGGETLFASRNIARCKVSDAMKRGTNRKGVVKGKRGSVRVDPGGRRNIKK